MPAFFIMLARKCEKIPFSDNSLHKNIAAYPSMFVFEDMQRLVKNISTNGPLSKVYVSSSKP